MSGESLTHKLLRAHVVAGELAELLVELGQSLVDLGEPGPGRVVTVDTGPDGSTSYDAPAPPVVGDDVGSPYAMVVGTLQVMRPNVAHGG